MKTKQEVIKALELCAQEVTEEYCPCDNCPYGDYVDESCSGALKRDAAELLKDAPDKLIITKLPEAENES